MISQNEIQNLKKFQYSISEVAEMFGVNTSLLRFWEKEFPQIKPHKNAKGNRYYRKEDISLIYKIYQVVKIEGHTLDGAKNVLKSGKSKLEETPKNQSINNMEVKNDLKSIREKLVALYLEL